MSLAGSNLMASLKGKGLEIMVFCIPGKEQRNAYSELKGKTTGTWGGPWPPSSPQIPHPLLQCGWRVWGRYTCSPWMVTDRHQTDQTLQIFWSFMSPSPIFFLLIMVVKPLTYCKHVLTSLFLQQPSQIDTFPIYLSIFITGTCFVDLKNRHCLYLNWHTWKMKHDLDPTNRGLSGSFSVCAFTQQKACSPRSPCWEHTASWGRRSLLKSALQSLDPGGFAFAGLWSPGSGVWAGPASFQSPLLRTLETFVSGDSILSTRLSWHYFDQLAWPSFYLI